MTKSRLLYESGVYARSLFCDDENNLSLIENKFDVKVTSRDNFFILKGREENVNKVKSFFHDLEKLQERGSIQKEEFMYLLSEINQEEKKGQEIFQDKIEVPGKKRVIVPKTEGQKRYIESIRNHSVVFGIGPAGTGKTYLAMAMAVASLKVGITRRIILTRPAVEAGESLGFLPGDLYEKVLPYLRPLYDALYDMIDEQTLERYRDRGIIEVVPLAYMRGRTLNDAFIILDEAQNSTIEQMRMFLTRLGFGSKAVVTGDITQIDLPSYRSSGLIQVQNILKNINDIDFIYLDEKDVVRHALVSKIIKAYENYDKAQEKEEIEFQKKERQKDTDNQPSENEMK